MPGAASWAHRERFITARFLEEDLAIRRRL
jgi:hypothetical protein